MFSVITNIYNKKTKGPTLMELFTATEKLKTFFLTTRDVRCVHHGWHGTHRYESQVLATHASSWVNRYSSLLRWSVPLGQRGHVAMVERITGFWHVTKEKNHKAWCQGSSGATATVVGLLQTRALSTVLVTLFRYWRTSQWKWAGLQLQYERRYVLQLCCVLRFSCNKFL